MFLSLKGTLFKPILCDLIQRSALFTLFIYFSYLFICFTWQHTSSFLLTGRAALSVFCTLPGSKHLFDAIVTISDTLLMLGCRGKSHPDRNTQQSGITHLTFSLVYRAPVSANKSCKVISCSRLISTVNEAAAAVLIQYCVPKK